jgi:hypothetical protein
MREFRLFFTTLIGLTVLAACRDDVIVEPPPPLEGTYEGIYRYEKTGQPVMEQFITWIFTTNTVLMDMDSTKQTDRKFCDIEGRYIVGDGIDIYIPIVKGRDSSSYRNRTRQACNEDLGPYGKFQLDQSVTNKVTLTRNNVKDSAFQRIILTKISDEF